MRVMLALSPLIALLAAFACGGDDADVRDVTPTVERPAASPTEPGNPAPAPTATVPAGETGIPAVDAALEAALAGDVAALAAQAALQQLPCETEPMGIGGPPACESGEGDGTLVDVFSVAQCEGAYIREDAVAGAFENLFGGVVELYGVYRVSQRYFPEGVYTIVLEVRGDDGMWTGREVIVNDEGITGINYGCAESAEILVQNRRLTDAIMPPE